MCPDPRLSKGQVVQISSVPRVDRGKMSDKTFPQKVKSLMLKKYSLLANHRVIVDNFHEQEKPSFSPENLIANRKRGMSFSCIGKKLGIDNTKGEVLNVFTVMKECDDTLTDVQEVQHPALRNYPIIPL